MQHIRLRNFFLILSCENAASQLLLPAGPGRPEVNGDVMMVDERLCVPAFISVQKNNDISVSASSDPGNKENSDRDTIGLSEPETKSRGGLVRPPLGHCQTLGVCFHHQATNQLTGLALGPV